MLFTDQILQLHQETVARWHEVPVSNQYRGALHLVCEQHSFNFRLWHEEDIARSPDVADGEIARVKRRIDRLNQQRNDQIEKLDDWISDWLVSQGGDLEIDAPINSETSGSIVDRLSIMSLRIYHLQEQLDRADVDDQHLRSVEQKLAICYDQRTDLATALHRLLDDLKMGRKRHKTYRQFKMYNDPTLNPYLYSRTTKKAS